MAANEKILIADGDIDGSEELSRSLRADRFETEIVRSGEAALRRLESYRPDLVLLELALPGIDGFQTCREIRVRHGLPVIVISARDNIPDKVRALDLGADDYLVRPCDRRELTARIRAVLRRCHPDMSPIPQATQTTPNEKRVEYPDLVISLTNYSVLYRGRSVEMPPKELELLYFLASSPNQVFTREQLLDNLWGYEYLGDTRTVDVHIKRLREKIKDHPCWAIATVWGVGYQFKLKS